MPVATIKIAGHEFRSSTDLRLLFIERLNVATGLDFHWSFYHFEASLIKQGVKEVTTIKRPDSDCMEYLVRYEVPEQHEPEPEPEPEPQPYARRFNL